MRITRLLPCLCAAALVGSSATLLVSAGLALPAAANQPAEMTVETMHFAVSVGPDDATACDVVGDLYRPAGATAAHPVAAVLTTNGFGGSKDDQEPLARMLAARGYAVLSYSGLGFGGSTCKVTLDDPRYDGKAASALVSFLGGQDGIAFADATHRQPVAAPDFIKRDAVDHRGTASANDPRVGMTGGSYGGQAQFAAASVDPRIDTIVPIITWNDLGYSLSPNSIDQFAGVRSTTPGVTKAVWVDGLSLVGFTSPGLEGYQADPARAVPCPNFADDVCPILASGLLRGWTDQAAEPLIEHVSVSRYLDAIAIPTLLVQGQSDTLFNLNEAQATYDALSARGVDVKMIWQQGGHSGPNAPGEFKWGDPDPDAQYVTGRIVDWFDNHLLGSTVSTGPAFAYFQDWVEYSGNAAPAYATADTPAVGSPAPLHLSDGGALVDAPGQVRAGTQSLVTGISGLPVFTGERNPRAPIPLPEFSVPGTSANWATEPLQAALTVVGAPTLDFAFRATPGGNGSLERSTVLFAQIVDIGPDGAATTIRDHVAPIRVINPGAPIHVTMPAIVHRFEPGHRVGLRIEGGNSGFRGNNVSQLVEFPVDGGQTLTLPVVG